VTTSTIPTAAKKKRHGDPSTPSESTIIYIATVAWWISNSGENTGDKRKRAWACSSCSGTSCTTRRNPLGLTNLNIGKAEFRDVVRESVDVVGGRQVLAPPPPSTTGWMLRKMITRMRRVACYRASPPVLLKPRLALTRSDWVLLFVVAVCRLGPWR
jgi:hypothetical protein